MAESITFSPQHQPFGAVMFGVEVTQYLPTRNNQDVFVLHKDFAKQLCVYLYLELNVTE